MAASGPTILVVDNDRDERVAIAAALRAAGIAVVAVRDRGGRAAISRKRFAAAIIALPDGGAEFLPWARRRQPGLPALIVGEAAALQPADEGINTFVARPVDLCQLLGCAFKLVVRDDDVRPHHGHAAEFAIAAAKLACLASRHTAAAATGASRLAHDLTRQIGETRAMHRGLAAAMAIGRLVVFR